MAPFFISTVFPLESLLTFLPISEFSISLGAEPEAACLMEMSFHPLLSVTDSFPFSPLLVEQNGDDLNLDANCFLPILKDLTGFV